MYFVMLSGLFVFFLMPVTPLYAVQKESKVTIAVLSRTDFLPDATGVYGKRSRHGDDKMPGTGDDHQRPRRSRDKGYDHLHLEQGYNAEAVGLPEILSDAILEHLVRSNRFTAVERKALRTAVLEQRFAGGDGHGYLDSSMDAFMQATGTMSAQSDSTAAALVDGAKTVDMLRDFRHIGTTAGAKYLILGNIHKLGSRTESRAVPFSDRGRTADTKTAMARIDLRVVDTATSTVSGADSLNIEVSEFVLTGGGGSQDDYAFLDDVARQAAVSILDMVFPARLVEVNPLIVSRGRNDNINSGDTFSVYRQGREIREPGSKTVIGYLKKDIGEVRVNRVDDTMSYVEPVRGKGFKAGDLVRQSFAANINALPARTLTPVTGKVKKAEPFKGLPTVAIGLVKTGSTARTGRAADEHSPQFTDTIITRLLQSKRFKVIDRQEVDQFLDEQTAQALADNKPLTSALGTLKGCDYLILGAVQNFSLEESQIKLPHSSLVMNVLDGYAEGNIRIVDVSSGEVLESRKIFVEQQLDAKAHEERLIASLADDFAARVVADLINAIYPIKIAAVADEGTVYVNRGKDGGLNPGATLTVYRPGESIVDPDTGVVLGSRNSRLDILTLTSVEENLSLAEVNGGSRVKKGDLLKIISNEKNEDGVRETQRTGKATLAVVKIKLNARKKFDDGALVSALQDGTMDQITDNLVDALDKSNRFILLERREVDQLLDEKLFQAATKGHDIRQYIEELQGSDYLIAGELTAFYLQVTRNKVPYIDEIEVQKTGFIEGNLRIVDVRNGQVITSDKVRIKKKFTKTGVEEIRTRLIDAFVLDAAASIVQRIYPIKVLAAQPLRVLATKPDGTLYINRGADGGIQLDSLFSVLRPGQELIDPDSGSSFGTAETFIATVRIKQVEEARSVAVLVSGETPMKGDILRKDTPAYEMKTFPMKVAW